MACVCDSAEVLLELPFALTDIVPTRLLICMSSIWLFVDFAVSCCEKIESREWQVIGAEQNVVRGEESRGGGWQAATIVSR